MNKQKGFFTIFLLVILGLIVVGIGGYFYYIQNFTTPTSDVAVDTTNATDTSTTETSATTTAEENTNGKCGFYVTSPEINSKAVFPLTVTGMVDNTNREALGCSWQMFEGQAGIAELYFNYNNEGWKPVGTSSSIIVENWMSEKTSFKTILNFNNAGIGLPPNTPMKIVFTEENPAVIRPSLTFELPLNFLKSDADKKI